VKLAADANVLLAAVLGGRARLILGNTEEIEEILTAEATFAEVEEYAVVLARKRRLPTDLLLLAVASLPVTILDREAYSNSISEAKRRIGRRDPDDVDILALAIHFEIPIWSNDRDFEDCGIERYTTEDLLRKLRMLEGK
jgi:predicted nucleic acid-binding protein